MAFKFLQRTKELSPKEEITESLKCVKEELIRNHQLFNLAESSEMIDFAVHRDIALKAQYDYLLKKYKGCL